MKNFILLIFMLFTVGLNAQSNFRVNVMGNVDFSHHRYTLTSSFVIDSLANPFASGHSIGLEFEFDLGNQLVFSSGLYHAKMVHEPGLDLGAFYGASFPINDSLHVYMNGPYLGRHEFSVIRLPLWNA